MSKKNILLSHNMQTIYAVILGIIVGFLNIEPILEFSHIIAELSIKLMKLMALPLLFLSLLCSSAHFKNFSEIRAIGIKIVKYTLITTLVATLVAQALFFGFSGWLLSFNEKILMPNESLEKTGFLSTILAMVPDNFLGAFLNYNVLAIVLMALTLSIAILNINEREKDIVFTFFSGLLNALMKIVHYGLKFIPISVFAFVSILFTEMATKNTSITTIFALCLTVILANLLQGIIILPIFLYFKGINPWSLFKSVKEALVLAFFTRSSAATLPVTLDHAIKNARIKEDIARLSLPLCTTINMNGCAQFILITVCFVSAFTGNPLSFSEHIAMIFIAVLAAVGNAGVPMGCFFLASSILATKEIPVYIMGSILPLYTFMDMIETSLNVWSDVCVTKIVDNEC